MLPKANIMTIKRHKGTTKDVTAWFGSFRVAAFYMLVPRGLL